MFCGALSFITPDTKYPQRLPTMSHWLVKWSVIISFGILFLLPQSLRRAKSAKPLRVSRLPLSPFGLEPLLTAQRTGGTSERKLAKIRQLFDFGMNMIQGAQTCEACLGRTLPRLMLNQPQPYELAYQAHLSHRTMIIFHHILLLYIPGFIPYQNKCIQTHQNNHQNYRF